MTVTLCFFNGNPCKVQRVAVEAPVLRVGREREGFLAVL